MARTPELVDKYGLDYELRFVNWYEKNKGDDTVFNVKTLIETLLDRGIITRAPAPAPFGVYAWTIHGNPPSRT